MKAYEQTATGVSPENLPTFTCPTEEKQKAAIGDLRFLLQTWMDGGCASPFSFADLMKHAAAGADVATVVKRLLGPLWAKWFVEDPNAHTTVIPRQAGLMILRALDALQLDFKENKEMKTRASQAFGVMVEASAKRLRTA